MREKILDIYLRFGESPDCRIYPNAFFGYTKVTVEQPLPGSKNKPDTAKRDYERIPLLEDIDAYFAREVLPHVPDAWMDRSKDKVGYEINFTKYFYRYKPLRPVEEIARDLMELDRETEGLLKRITGQ